MRLSASAALALACLVHVHAAYGDEPQGSNEPSASTPPDIVRMKNGGIFRGTILELVPGEHVVLQLPSGTKRSVPLAATTYAGPAAGEPVAPARAAPEGPPKTQPYATIHTDRAHVTLQAAEPDLTFHLETEAVNVTAGNGIIVEGHGYSRLCTAPCSVDLPVGYHRLALSRSGGELASAGDETAVSDGETIRGSYSSNAWVRVLGWVVGVVGFGGGSALAFYGVSRHDCEPPYPGATFCVDTPHADTALMIGGIAIAGVSALAWWPLTHTGDSASFDVTSARQRSSLERKPGVTVAIEPRTRGASGHLQVSF